MSTTSVEAGVTIFATLESLGVTHVFDMLAQCGDEIRRVVGLVGGECAADTRRQPIGHHEGELLGRRELRKVAAKRARPAR